MFQILFVSLRVMIEIQQARREQADAIARLTMMAMTDECCQNFCGEGRGLDDFLRMMTLLVERDDSQYSYRNTLVAVEDDRVVGIAVSYDGAQLHQLRLAFITMAKEFLNRDHSGMDDETQAGELYLDSFAVLPEYRRRGIGTRLLLATAEKAERMNIQQVGLLVDKGNPTAEQLYLAVGFRYEGDSHWGGHPMKHLVRPQFSAFSVI